jgi:transposase
MKPNPIIIDLKAYERRIGELEERMAEQTKGDEDIERLRSIPGVGPKIVYAFTAHVGVERFENAGQVSNYPGLTPQVYISGSLVRYGHITKQEERVSAGGLYPIGYTLLSGLP